jgi:hypothetical protein
MDVHETENVHYNDRVYQQGNCGYDEKTTNTCVICKLQSVVVGEKATGDHTYEDDFNCETALACEVCLKTLKEALAHDIKTTILYEKGYTAEGLKTVACQNEGCSHSEGEKKADALFTCLGYSAPEDGRGGIAVGYTINNEAIREYEKATGKALKYGAFAVLKDKLGTDDLFNAKGEVVNGAISAEISGNNYAAVELKITGFTDDYKDTKLAMGVYVAVTDGETTEYSYLQSGTPNENEKYSFISYNDIVGNPTTDKETS